MLSIGVVVDQYVHACNSDNTENSMRKSTPSWCREWL